MATNTVANSRQRQVQSRVLFEKTAPNSNAFANPQHEYHDHLNGSTRGCFIRSWSVCSEWEASVVSFLLRSGGSLSSRSFSYNNNQTSAEDQIASCPNPPFACFSRMMAACCSLVRWNSVPESVFFFFYAIMTWLVAIRGDDLRNIHGPCSASQLGKTVAG